MSRRDLETVYREHSRMVYWTAYGLLRSESDAGDVVQNVFLRAMKHMDSISRMEDSQLRGWLYRVAVNLCMDVKRKQRRETPIDELPEVISGREYEMPEANALSADQHRRVKEAVEVLPQIYREAVMLHYYSGLNYKEIAELIGSTEGTVKSRIFRAKERLYELLKEGESNG